MQPTMYMIGNAHLDPVWLWRYPQGLAEIKATFRSALDRLDEFDGFVFTCASAMYYQWVEHQDPAMFEQIRTRVAQGRWVLAGGMWVQPDCNAPSGESFARHMLYSQRYFLSRFGQAAAFGYNVDSFGHNAQLPQLLKQGGMGLGYVYMRPGPHEQPAVQQERFIWQGLDGSTIRAYRIPFSYNASRRHLGGRLEQISQLAQQTGRPQMCFYGVGNHGGGPTIRDLQTIEHHQSQPGGEAIRLSEPPAYFAHPDLYDDAPVVQGDLLHHASGCYSVVMDSKRMNRLCERALYGAEAAAALCALSLGGTAAPDLHEHWQTLLFNQFHDILGGCSTRDAMQDALHQWQSVHARASYLQNEALQRISWAVDTSRPGIKHLSKDTNDFIWEMDGQGTPIVVFNLHPFPVCEPVQIHGRFARVCDDTQTALPVQLVRAQRTNGEHDKWDTLFMAELPAFGYATFWAYTQGEALTLPSHSVCEQPVIDNGLLRVQRSTSGAGIDVYDARTGQPLLLDGGRALFIDETHCDAWAHGEFSFRKLVGRFEPVSAQLLEDGPVRSTLRLVTRLGDTDLTQDYTLLAGERTVHCAARADVRAHHRMLKISFPVGGLSGAAGATAFGAQQRTCDGIEYPAQNWAAAWGAGGGISVCGDWLSAFDAAEDELRITVLRTALYADHYGQRDGLGDYIDQGERRFAWRLDFDPSQPDLLRNARQALCLLQPCTAIVETYHAGPLARIASLGATADTVQISAIKRAHDGNGWIVRAWECAGTPSRAALRLGTRTMELAFKPFQVRTLLLPDDAAAPVVEVDLLERPL